MVPLARRDHIETSAFYVAFSVDVGRGGTVEISKHVGVGRSTALVLGIEKNSGYIQAGGKKKIAGVCTIFT